MRVRFRWTTVAMSLVLVTGSAAAGASFATAAPLQPCKDVALVGVKGSGEDANSRDGVGPTVGTAWSMIEQAVSDLDYAYVAIPYPAEGVDTMYPTKLQVAGLATGPGNAALAVTTWYKTKVTTFLRSIDAGVGTLDTAIDLRSRNCEDESIVLVGYSQGAAVIHRYLNRLEDRQDWDVMDRIAAVVLISDPDRVPGSREQSLGGASIGAQGVAYYAGSVKLAPARRDIPADLADVTVSVCMKRDIVCDFTPKGLLTFPIGKRIHTDSYKDKKNLADAINYLADLL